MIRISRCEFTSKRVPTFVNTAQIWRPRQFDNGYSIRYLPNVFLSILIGMLPHDLGNLVVLSKLTLMLAMRVSVSLYVSAKSLDGHPAL